MNSVAPGKVVVLIFGAAGRLIAMLNGCETVWAGLLPSVTVTVKLAVPFGPVGVPVMAPVEAFSFKGAGSAPAVIEYTRVPKPDATTVWLYAVPSTSAGSVVVLIFGAAGKLTVMLNACVADCAGLLESTTFIVKFAVPLGPVGVPETTPEFEMFIPAGNAPALLENVNGPNPPVSAIVWLYNVPSTPAGSTAGVMTGGAG
jgi:hypothetical protein